MNVKKCSRVFISLFLMLSFIFSCSKDVSQDTGTSFDNLSFDFNNLTPTSDYVFYYDLATLPSLYIAINMFTHDKETYLYQARETIDPAKVPSYVAVLDSPDDMKNKIAELHEKNPNATYTFYVLDNQFAWAVTLFYSIGIKNDNIKVVLLNDGKGTYKDWADLFNTTMAFNTFNEYKTRVDDVFDRLYNDPNLDPWDLAYGYYHIPVLEYDNFSLWTQWPELLSTSHSDEEFKKYVANKLNKYLKVNPLDYYHFLSEEDQSAFLTLLGLDRVWSDADGGNGDLQNQTIGDAFDASDKPNIIITGTRYIDQKHIEDTIAYYGDGYDYFYKAHPKYPEVAPTNKTIVMLPYVLPMEGILWAYGDKIAAIGGYQSSLYMNAQAETKKFFYDIDSGSEMVEPLNLMYEEGLLGDDEYVHFFVIE